MRKGSWFLRIRENFLSEPTGAGTAREGAAGSTRARDCPRPKEARARAPHGRRGHLTGRRHAGTPRARARGHATGAGTPQARARHGRRRFAFCPGLPYNLPFWEKLDGGIDFVKLWHKFKNTLNVTGEHNNPGRDTDVDNENSDNDDNGV